MHADTAATATTISSGGGRLWPAVRRVAGRLASLVLTMFLASLLIFFSRFLVPGDPIRFLMGGRKPTEEAIAALTQLYGFDKPAWLQYVNWVGGILQGDFGKSLQYRQAVGTVIADRLPVTLELAAMTAIMIAVVGIIAGAVAALKRGKLADRIILSGTTALGAIPSFVGSILLIAIFAVGLGWFPSYGSGDGFFDSLYHLTLPAIALSLVFLVLIVKVTRAAMVEQLTHEHVEVATSRGISPFAVVRRHVIRNSIGPVITVGGMLVAGLLVASTIVESAFGIAGIGSLLVKSVGRLDFPVVQAIILLVITAFVVVNTIVDLLEPIIDPRSAAGASAR